MLKLNSATINFLQDLNKCNFEDSYRPFGDGITPAFTLAAMAGWAELSRKRLVDPSLIAGNYVFRGEQYSLYVNCVSDWYLEKIEGRPLSQDEIDVNLVEYSTVDELIEAPHIAVYVQDINELPTLVGERPDCLEGAEILTIQDIFKTVLVAENNYIVIIGRDDLNLIPPEESMVFDHSFEVVSYEVAFATKRIVEVFKNKHVDHLRDEGLGLEIDSHLNDDIGESFLSATRENKRDISAREAVDVILTSIINRIEDGNNVIPHSYIKTLTKTGLVPVGNLESMEDTLIYYAPLGITLVITPESKYCMGFLMEESRLGIQTLRNRIRFDGI